MKSDMPLNKETETSTALRRIRTQFSDSVFCAGQRTTLFLNCNDRSIRCYRDSFLRCVVFGPRPYTIQCGMTPIFLLGSLTPLNVIVTVGQGQSQK